ncbi:MAG TPA: disulfide bond formation protein B [Burkholderiaceae bacterium]
MKSTKLILATIALASFGLIGGALYFQIVQYMEPCPWCVIQRYFFIALGITCLVSVFLTQKGARIGTWLAMLFALGGTGAAGWHVWIKMHPEISCGLDPMETSLNHIFTAKLIPILFRANGICTDELDPFLGLQLPSWSLIWFVGFAVVLLTLALRGKKA